MSKTWGPHNSSPEHWKAMGDVLVTCIACKRTFSYRAYAHFHGSKCKALLPAFFNDNDDVHTKLVKLTIQYLNINEKFTRPGTLSKNKKHAYAQKLRSLLREIRNVAHNRSEEIYIAALHKEGKLGHTDKLTCEHCGKKANLQNYIKWHGDSCRNKS